MAKVKASITEKTKLPFKVEHPIGSKILKLATTGVVVASLGMGTWGVCNRFVPNDNIDGALGDSDIEIVDPEQDDYEKPEPPQPEEPDIGDNDPNRNPDALPDTNKPIKKSKNLAKYTNIYEVASSEEKFVYTDSNGAKWDISFKR